MMGISDLKTLLPLALLAGGVLFTMLGIAVKRNHALALVSVLATLAAALFSLYVRRSQGPHALNDLFLVDRFGAYFQALILCSAFAVAIFSYISLSNFFPDKRKEEYYVLLLLAVMGTMTMVISVHFISFFVGLELLNIALYALISYYRERPKAIEAGVKYLILAAMSSAILLFGMALIYTATGTLSFQGLGAVSLRLRPFALVLLLGGSGLLLSGIGFKLALAPFHAWAPDVYEGASSPVSAFIAVISKGAMVAVLLRFFTLSRLYEFPTVVLLCSVLALLSMLVGNLLALFQNNIKRMLAYSSVGHFGYLLVALISGRGSGTPAVMFYLAAYSVSVLTAFGLITVLSTSDSEAMDIDNYAGLFWKKPVSAALLAIALLSLAGIPLTAGFMGKFLLLRSGVANSHWLLVFVLIGSSVIGLFYYLRFVFAMMRTGDGGARFAAVAAFHTPRYSQAAVILLMVLGMAILWLGSFPASMITLIQSICEP